MSCDSATTHKQYRGSSLHAHLSQPCSIPSLHSHVYAGPEKRHSIVQALAKSIKKRVAFGGAALAVDEGSGATKATPGAARAAKRRSSAAAGKKQVAKSAAAAGKNGKPPSDMAVICGWCVLCALIVASKHPGVAQCQTMTSWCLC